MARPPRRGPRRRSLLPAAGRKAQPVSGADSAHARFERELALAQLAGGPFDVVVIGGGITGAGVALDAAARGLRTALVERSDFASGTSSKSSKLVHGGLRYLQQHELGLVYESLAERQRLLQNAPHLVTPLPFLIPLFGRDGVVSKAVARSYSVALWLYDLTGGLRIGKRHRRIGRAQALRHLPTLRTDRLVAGFLYFDAQGDDARLVASILRTAVLDHGAVAANYVEATGLRTDAAGQVTGVEVVSRDPVHQGAAGDGDLPRWTIATRAVVNAAGVWSDQVESLSPGGHHVALRPAKGVHVTVPRPRLPTDIAAVIPVPEDRRSVFVVPWPDADLVYIGTTDTPYDGSLDDPGCTPEDVEYLLAAVNAATTSELRPSDVTGVWAGLRPLLAPADGADLPARTADLSRRHSVHAPPSGIVTVTGGKLTTYRKMAADAVDAAWRHLEQRGDLGPLARCPTANLRLIGAPAHGGRSTRADGGRDGLSVSTRRHLFSRYGTEMAAVVALGQSCPVLMEQLVPQLPYLRAEIVFAARFEMARCLDDALSRRTRMTIQDAQAAQAAAPEAAKLLAQELGWDAETTAREVARFDAAVQHDLQRAGLAHLGAPR